MLFNIVSNINNGVGLQADYELLRGVLENLGHQVVGIQFNAPFQSQPADVSIFLEIVAQHYDLAGRQRMEQSRKNWFVPNPEWYFVGWNPQLKDFDAVLCKTRSCEKIFAPLVEEKKLHFTGFFSDDYYDAEIPRLRKFLHVAGRSQTKNTLAVIEAWRGYRIPHQLTVVSEHFGGYVTNVEYLRRVPEATIRRYMNEHIFHLMPSMYEGFGHVIHEGFGCGAVMMTTDAEPMNEWIAPRELLMHVNGMRQHHLAPLHFVGPEQVEESVRKAVALDDVVIKMMSEQARGFFKTEKELFIERLKELIERG